MVAVLVVVTVVVFLAVEGILRLLTRRKTAEVKLPSQEKSLQLLPAGLFVHPGHMWAEIQRTGRARVGYDDFIAHALGGVDRVVMRDVGERLRRGEPLLYLERKGRRLGLPAPLSGTITSRNERLLSNPKAPAHTWTCTLEPECLGDEIESLKVGDSARAWLRSETRRFSAWLATLFPARPGIALPDGGVPVSGILADLDDSAWDSFQQSFLQLDEGSGNST